MRYASDFDRVQFYLEPELITSFTQSGIVTFNPNIAQGQTTSTGSLLSSPLSWALTVDQHIGTSANNSRTELSLWVSSSGANYSNNFELGYDACFFWLSPLLLNTMWRGQTDDGTCSTMFDEACINDLQGAANTYAVQMVGGYAITPESNLTSTSLPTVCGNMARLMTDNFPQSCAPFFNGPGQVSGNLPSLGGRMFPRYGQFTAVTNLLTALTGPTSLIAASKCRADDGFSLIWSQFGPTDNATYSLTNWWVAPMLTTFMPIADAARPVTAAVAKSVMACVRAKNRNPGSLPPIPPPQPTPLSAVSSSNSSTNATGTFGGFGLPAANAPSSSTAQSPAGGSGARLGGGAIAGIAIGCGVAFVIVIAGALFVRRRNRRNMAGRRPSPQHYSEVDGKSHGHVNVRELGSHGGVVEAPHSNTYHEMDSPIQLHELHHKRASHEPRAELPG